jgi:hypothetical protein
MMKECSGVEFIYNSSMQANLNFQSFHGITLLITGSIP